ncbi:hypothetical protein Tco_1502893 [Tanacetum coccineum]
MAGIIVSVNKVSWFEACVMDFGVVILFHLCLASCFADCCLLPSFFQKIKIDFQKPHHFAPCLFLLSSSEPGNLDIPESSFLHPHALLASSILFIWLLLPRILVQHAYCKTPPYRPDLRRTALAFSFSTWSVSSVRPAPEPSMQDDPSIDSIHGSGRSSSAFVVVTRESSSRCSTMKSARICLFTDVLGMYSASFSFRSLLEVTFLRAFLQSLKNGIDFSADLDRNFHSAFVRILDILGMEGLKQLPLYPDIPLSLWYLPCRPHIPPNFCQLAFGMLCLPDADRLLRRCSAKYRGTPVMSSGFQANMSRLRLSNSHNALCPSSVRVELIAIVCSGYSG